MKLYRSRLNDLLPDALCRGKVKINHGKYAMKRRFRRVKNVAETRFFFFDDFEYLYYNRYSTLEPVVVVTF